MDSIAAEGTLCKIYSSRHISRSLRSFAKDKQIGLVFAMLTDVYNNVRVFRSQLDQLIIVLLYFDLN